MRLLILWTLLMSASAAADTEIFRCEQEDGTIAFQEMPCPEPAEKEPVEEETFAEEVPAEEAPLVSNVVEAPPRVLSQNRSECEKAARDAIDAIDLEMRSASYTKEEGQEYLAELRVLTRQLRACKQL